LIGLRFFLGIAALPVLGWPAVRWLAPEAERTARLAIAAAAGAVLLCGEMFAASLLGLDWNAPLLLAPIAVLWVIGAAAGREKSSGQSARAGAAAVLALAVSAAGVGLVAFAAATGRSTATDFLLFWGPQAQDFAQTRRIDIAFLAAPANYYMHPDYPPELPCLDAWAMLVAGRFAWGAALLELPLFLALSAAAFWGFARRALGSRPAAEWTALLVLLLGYCLTVSMSAGAAEPLLLFFEVVALAALVFGGSGALGAAALALAGCALTKVEGLAFSLFVSAAFCADRRRGGSIGRCLALLALPAAGVALVWVFFCARHGLLDIYRGGGRLHPEYFGIVLRELPAAGRYEAGYLPWLVVGTALAAGLRRGLELRAGLVAILFFLFTVYVYLHMSVEPTQWIAWSASRLLLTPLTALFFAAAGAAKPFSPWGERT